MNRTIGVRPPRLTVEAMESRITPDASWPVAGGPAAAPVVGTYGQYQELPRDGWDRAVRLSDGIAIAAAAGTAVRPAAAGTIEVLQRNTSNPYDSLVVVRETV